MRALFRLLYDLVILTAAIVLWIFEMTVIAIKEKVRKRGGEFIR